MQSLSNYKRIYWILGGLPKKNDKFFLKDVSKNVIKAYVIGKKTNFFVKNIKNHIPYKKSHNIKTAISDILKDVRKIKDTKFTVLFSPAAASYDQFKNFEDRGNYFKKIVKRILTKLNV